MFHLNNICADRLMFIMILVLCAKALTLKLIVAKPAYVCYNRLKP